MYMKHSIYVSETSFKECLMLEVLHYTIAARLLFYFLPELSKPERIYLATLQLYLPP